MVTSSTELADEREYLCVDGFLRTVIDARALKTALELRLIDHLAGERATTLADLTARFQGDGRGLRLLVTLLAANHVVEERDGEIALSQAFRRALRYRDLLEMKLEYTEFVLPDFTDLFTTALCSPETFFRRSRTFGLFRYDRALGHREEDYGLTRRWMRITTALTRYESRVCMRYHDFGGYEQVLDVGGNSGEFVLQICRRFPAISATVFDLPLVCEIGQAHVQGEPEAGRIRFVKGSALSDAWPRGHDLVTFKSMLHDWPDRDARRLIASAGEALRPGGTLLIFERGPLEVAEPSYALIPLLLFFRAFRSPETYTEQLAALGFRDIDVRRVDLETPFFLVTGRK